MRFRETTCVAAVGVLALLGAAGCGDDCVRCDEGGEGDGGPGDLPPGPVTLRNVEACPEVAGAYASNGRILTYASRLVPPRWPFRAEMIRYTVDGTDDPPPCDQSLPQTVRVFKSTSVPPPPNPEVHETIVVEGLEDLPMDQLVERQLSAPLRLDEGESLYVTISLRSPESGGVSCVKYCRGGSPEEDDFESTTPEPPFLWVASRAESSSGGIVPANVIVDVDGELL